MAASIVGLPSSLRPLPLSLRQGLTAVSVFGFLSFICSIALFVRLAYRLVNFKRKTQARLNQFYILIFNLVFADIQQSVAFLLNAQWLRENAIDIHTSTCWAQGWFVSTGDLASGVFTFAIAVHSFFDIVWDVRLGHKSFVTAIVCLWAFVYIMAVIGIALHPSDFYTRAGAWCWINIKYSNERLWLHYFWVIIAEFGTVLVYGLIFLILRRRVKESFYTTSETQIRAQSAANLIIAYPIVYVVCTLPLVIARLTSMAGEPLTFIELCVAGSMITSNGWLDVLLYTVTRRSLIFGPTDLGAEHARALDTFRLRPDTAYGVTTTIEASSTARRPSSRHRRKLSHRLDELAGQPHSRHDSTEELVGLQGVKVQTETVVQTVEMNPMGAKTSDNDLHGRGTVSFDSRSLKSGEK